MPGVIGYIDGTHVKIQRPTEHEDVFVNRKGFHSINVQVMALYPITMTW
jgi:DDE superfamily endonuclease